MKYTTEILNLKPLKLKLSNVLDVDISLICSNKLEENTLLTNTIFTQKIDKHDSTICMFTSGNMIVNDMFVNFLPYKYLKHFKKGSKI